MNKKKIVSIILGATMLTSSMAGICKQRFKR